MTLLEDMQKIRQDLDKMEALIDTKVASIDSRLTNIEKSFGEWTAVAEAISKKAVTSKQFVMGVLALMVPFVILAITILATHK
jgi:tetrahydromethanopterin S-methyltransferase subunit B